MFALSRLFPEDTREERTVAGLGELEWWSRVRSGDLPEILPDFFRRLLRIHSDRKPRFGVDCGRSSAISGRISANKVRGLLGYLRRENSIIFAVYSS